MFEYFPDRYVWNLSFLLSLASGAELDELDRACRPVRDRIGRGEDPDVDILIASLVELGERVARLGDADRDRAHHLSAADKYSRAANYLGVAERMRHGAGADRRAAYERVLELFGRAIELGMPSCRRVEIPYGSDSLPAYFLDASDGRSARPCVIQCNGLDSTKEMLVQAGLWRALAGRGISTLAVDSPGTGEALRMRGLTAIPESERWAAACVDFLARRSEVDRDRVGIVGWSLGGYYAPRAAAFEPRLAFCVAWGANHNWGALQLRRLADEGENPVPHYWEHVNWVWGTSSTDEFLKLASRISLVGVVERIEMPFLIVHGEGDRQIPVSDAHQSYEEATRSRLRELKVFSAETGATEHVGIDNTSLPIAYIADWIAARVGRDSPPA